QHGHAARAPERSSSRRGLVPTLAAVMLCELAVGDGLARFRQRRIGNDQVYVDRSHHEEPAGIANARASTNARNRSTIRSIALAASTSRATRAFTDSGQSDHGDR